VALYEIGFQAVESESRLLLADNSSYEFTIRTTKHTGIAAILQTCIRNFYFEVLHPVASTLSRLLEKLSLTTTI
jgi:hypothetical protein